MILDMANIYAHWRLGWSTPRRLKTCRYGVPSHNLTASVWRNPPCLQPPHPAFLPVPAAAQLSAPNPCIDTWCPASPFGHSTASGAPPLALGLGGVHDPTAAVHARSSTARSG